MKLNIGGITEAGLSRRNKTGNWSYYMPRFQDDKCNGCGICETFCPESCIDIVEKEAKADQFYCKGCGICVRECPSEAIILEAKRGAAG